jgi:hypothetical protein
MATVGKSDYPKATPLRSPEQIALQSSRLSAMQEELAAQTKHLKQWKTELEERAIRLRRWTSRLAVACVITLLLAGSGAWFASRSPVQTQSLPDSTANCQPPTANCNLLETLGSLSATHLYQTHLNIGLVADGVESEIYTVEEAEQNLQSIVAMMKQVEEQHAKLAKSGLDADDQESLRQLQAVSAMLHLQVESLRAYWTTGESVHAEQYHQARKATWQGLSAVLGF